jgi:TIR domain
MMDFDVFISYSSKDKEIADAACAALEMAGIRCWIAPRDIVPGREWGAAIVEAIDNSRLMVLIFSSGANQSRQIYREVERAVSKGIPILPMRIEDVPPADSLAYYMNAVQWLDAHTPPPEQHLQRLVDATRTLLRIDLQNAGRASAPEARSSGIPRSHLSSIATPAAAVATEPSNLVADAAVSDATAEARDEKRERPTWSRFKAAAAAGLVVLAVLAAGIAVYRLTLAPAKPPAPVETEWVSLPLGTRIVNRSAQPVPTYSGPDLKSARSIDIRPGQAIPPSGTDQLLARKKVGQEDWIRFPLGDSRKNGYVPASSVTILSPS